MSISSLKSFSAAVVGLGRIGQGYDYDSVGPCIQTHAKAFSSHEGYALIAAVDPDKKQHERFEIKYKKPAYADLDSMFAKHRPEIVSICVPTSHHFQVFSEVLRRRPLAVICEKPIASTSAEARQMSALAKESDCALIINYMRRFEPGVIELKQLLTSGIIGEIYKGEVWYSKGILNNGSHFLDLLIFLLGNAGEIQLLKKGRSWPEGDSEPDFSIRFGGAIIYFLALREEFFSMGELRLIGTKGILDYSDSGHSIELREVHDIKAGIEYKVLGEKKLIASDLYRYQWHVLEALYNHLTLGEPLNSNGESALESLIIVENILRKQA